MKKSSTYLALGIISGLLCLVLIRYFGVGIKDIAKFILYEVIFIALPGLAIYAAISVNPKLSAKFVFMGWALGYALHTLFFILCAALDKRSYQFLFPLATLVIFILVYFGAKKNKISIAWPAFFNNSIKSASILIACLTVFIFAMALIFYKELPLFEDALKSNPSDQWLYGQDYFFQLGTINEAILHFPITDPRISGESLPYYNFFYYHAAAVCDATGIDSSIFYFRLYFIPFLGVIIGLIKTLSSRINKGNLAWIAALIPFVLGEASMHPSVISLFLHVPIIQLAISPTLMMGLMMYLAGLCAIYEMVDNWNKASNLQKTSLMGLAVFFVLICGLTKAVALVNIIGGQLIWIVVDMLILRKKPQIPLLLPLLSLVIFAYFSYAYRDIGQRFIVTPLTTIYRQPAFSSLFTDAMPQYLRSILAMALVPLSLLGVMGLHLIGIIGWALSKPMRDLLSRPEIGLFYQLLASIICLYTFNNRTFDQVTFLLMGISAAAPLTLYGLTVIFKKTRSLSLLPKTAAALVCGALLILQIGNLPFAYRDRFKLGYRPGDSFGIYSNKLTPGLINGLIWLRAHSSPDEIVATNDPFGPTGWPASMNISAIAQRRVFLEGWIYSTQARHYDELQIMTKQVSPFADRLALNMQVFEQNDVNALNILRDKYGVRYLIVDKSRMGRTKFPNKIADTIFSNYAVEVYRVKD